MIKGVHVHESALQTSERLERTSLSAPCWHHTRVNDSARLKEKSMLMLLRISEKFLRASAHIIEYVVSSYISSPARSCPDQPVSQESDAARFGITVACDWDHGGQVWDHGGQYLGSRRPSLGSRWPVIGITAARFGITVASIWDHGGQVWDHGGL
jgi:hypothetical protein